MDFTNKTINLLTLHSGFHRFSINIFDTFSAIYFLSLGISFPIVSLTWACSCFLRVILRPLSLLLSEKIGLKKALIIGVFINSGLFLVISKVSGVNNWLYFYILYFAICDITYWLPYHSYVAIAGDENIRGKQVGTKNGFVTVLRMISPLLGGIIIANFGYIILYITALFIMLLSVFPLLFAVDIRSGKLIHFKETIKTINKKGMIMRAGDGILFMHIFIWTIVLFYNVGNYVTFGSLVTFELFTTVILSVLLGYLIDRGNGKPINSIGLVIIGIVIISRAFFVTSILAIIVIDILLAFGSMFYVNSFEVGFYNLAKESGNALWFNFFGELGWDLGAMISLILASGLFIFGVPLRFLMVFSLPGLFVVYYVLNHFYSRNQIENNTI